MYVCRSTYAHYVDKHVEGARFPEAEFIVNCESPNVDVGHQI